MVIGACTLELWLPESHGLKEKRMVLNRIKARLTGRFNVAVAEVDGQDSWQHSVLAVVSVSSSQQVLDSTFQKVVSEVERAAPGLLTRYATEYW